MKNLELGVDVAKVFAEYLRLETTNVGGASVLYPIAGARVYCVDLPKHYTHTSAAVVVRVRDDTEISGTAVSRASFDLRCYGATADPDSAKLVALATRRQVRAASDEHCTSGIVMSASIEGGSGELIWTPKGVRPWIPVFALSLIKP